MNFLERITIKMNVGNEIKIPRLDGDDKEARQELRVFMYQVKERLEYLSSLVEELLEAVGGEEK